MLSNDKELNQILWLVLISAIVTVWSCLEATNYGANMDQSQDTVEEISYDDTLWMH